MSFLLDTNVVSEWVKARPDSRVVRWLAQVDEDRVFISVITFGEIRHGIDRLSPGRRRSRLDDWLRHELPLRFEGRVLPIEFDVSDAWGAIVARRERKGQPIGSVDALIAATAQVHTLTVVTRNVADFRFAVESVYDPWSDEQLSGSPDREE